MKTRLTFNYLIQVFKSFKRYQQEQSTEIALFQTALDAFQPMTKQTMTSRKQTAFYENSEKNDASGFVDGAYGTASDFRRNQEEVA